MPACTAGDVVLAFGGKALDSLKAVKAAPKARTIGSLREKVLSWAGVRYLPTYDPAITQRDYARLPEIQWDIQLAARLATTGDTKPVLGEYRYVDDLSELIERIDEKYEKIGKPVDVGVDLETVGLNEYAPGVRIVSISFTVDEGKSDLLYFEEGESPVKPIGIHEALNDLDYWEGLWIQINWVLTSKKVKTTGANFKFDSNWMAEKWRIFCTNHTFDTLLVGSLLDENRSNSLKLHAKLFTPMGGYEEGLGGYDMARMDLVPKHINLAYAGADTDATYRVTTRFRKDLLKDRKLANFYVNLLHPASKAFEKLERTGALVDVPYYWELASELRSEKARLADAMLELVPNKLKAKYYDGIMSSLEEETSPFKPAFLKEYLFTPKGLNLKPKMLTAGGPRGDKPKTPSTAHEHLMMFHDDPEAAAFVDLLKEYSSAAKTLSTYVLGFLKHLRPDNRFHATYLLSRADKGNSLGEGAVTGRTSARDPAVQTISKHTKWAKRLRRAFIAPPGYVILQLDYSQGELRIVACIAEEPVMLKAYRDGMDLHAITAAKLMGYSIEDFMMLPAEERDEYRSRGKAGNFGLIYGMQAPGFQDYAYTAYGVKLTSGEAFTSREAFFDLYCKLPEWHDTYKAQGHRWESVRSPLGRVRHLPLINSKDREIRSMAERQAINSPIQSCLSDMMQLAMVHIDREYGSNIVQMFMMTHDSIALYVPEDDAVEWAKRIKQIMENLPLDKFGWKPQLTFVADAEVGVNLSELKKLKNL